MGNRTRGPKLGGGAQSLRDMLIDRGLSGEELSKALIAAGTQLAVAEMQKQEAAANETPREIKRAKAALTAFADAVVAAYKAAGTTDDFMTAVKAMTPMISDLVVAVKTTAAANERASDAGLSPTQTKYVTAPFKTDAAITIVPEVVAGAIAAPFGIFGGPAGMVATGGFAASAISVAMVPVDLLHTAGRYSADRFYELFFQRVEEARAAGVDDDSIEELVEKVNNARIRHAGRGVEWAKNAYANWRRGHKGQPARRAAGPRLITATEVLDGTYTAPTSTNAAGEIIDVNPERPVATGSSVASKAVGCARYSTVAAVGSVVGLGAGVAEGPILGLFAAGVGSGITLAATNPRVVTGLIGAALRATFNRYTAIGGSAVVIDACAGGDLAEMAVAGGSAVLATALGTKALDRRISQDPEATRLNDALDAEAGSTADPSVWDDGSENF